MTWPRNAEDRPGGQLGRSPKGKRNNIQSAQNIATPVRSVNVRNLREAAIRTRVDALTEKMDKELTADKRFFERWPDRQFRVRKSFRAESEITALMSGNKWPMDPGICWFTEGRQISPGLRVRGFFYAASYLDCDLLPEDAAQRIFSSLLGRPTPVEASRAVATRPLA